MYAAQERWFFWPNASLQYKISSRFFYLYFLVFHLKKDGAVQPGEDEALWRIISMCINTLLGGNEEDTRLFSRVPSDSTTCNEHKLKHMNLHLNMRKDFFYFEGGQTLQQIALWSVYLWSCSKPRGLALWELNDLKRSLPASVAPWLGCILVLSNHLCIALF